MRIVSVQIEVSSWRPVVIHCCTTYSRLHGFVWIYCVPKLRFMKRRFWNDIHHLLGFPVPSA